MNRRNFFKAIVGAAVAISGMAPIARVCDIGCTVLHFGRKRKLEKQWTSEPFRVMDLKLKK